MAQARLGPPGCCGRLTGSGRGLRRAVGGVEWGLALAGKLISFGCCSPNNQGCMLSGQRQRQDSGQPWERGPDPSAPRRTQRPAPTWMRSHTGQWRRPGAAGGSAVRATAPPAQSEVPPWGGPAWRWWHQGRPASQFCPPHIQPSSFGIQVGWWRLVSAGHRAGDGWRGNWSSLLRNCNWREGAGGGGEALERRWGEGDDRGLGRLETQGPAHHPLLFTSRGSFGGRTREAQKEPRLLKDDRG